MPARNETGALRDYRLEVERTRASGQATEHSYRPALQTLIEALGGEGVRAINEPSHVACGAPDFIVERRGVPLGHVECKDLGASLGRFEAGEQLKRYRAGLPNLILSDYLEFRWYREGELREKARLGRVDAQGAVAVSAPGVREVAALFGAFFEAAAPSIGGPRELAERMAAKTRLLREGVRRILAREEGAGSLRELLRGYREALIANLSREDFADLQAQTAAYGLFAARCLHDDSRPFTRESAAFTDTTPFLRDVFGRIAGPGADPRLAWIVDDLALLLARADMAAILADFGRRTRREDPVVHFYEDFLAAYDPRLREARGVYYTPEPVVSYIARSVDGLLRSRFGLADGLADTAAVEVETADGEAEARPRVLILDPAAGTGTFLREAVAVMRRTIGNKGMGGAWDDYVREHLLGRLFGFEFLMAPYVICHLKLALDLGGANAGFRMPDGERLGIFLTNTLEEAHESAEAPLFANEIAREAASADAVKRERPVMVVIGNPPYSGHSANKGAWIKGLLRGEDRSEATGSYFHVDGQPLGERNAKWLHDDYVKFIRFAQWRIERTGEGVLGFVTNHAWLDNPTFRGMRRSLMETFDEMRLLDLHGNAKKKERAPDGGRDENVFDIQQGVAISLFVKRRDGGGAPARVFHADLWGPREAAPDGGKYGWLAANDVETTQWAELAPKPPLFLFIPRDEERATEYEVAWKLTDIFPVSSTGIVSKRDKIAFHFEQNNLEKVLNDFCALDEQVLKEKYQFKESRDGKIGFVKKHVQDYGIKNEYIKPCLYRPFDYRWTYYTPKSKGFLGWPVYEVMRHMLNGKNLALITPRQHKDEFGVLATRFISAHKSVAAYDINYCLPLYAYAETTPTARAPNIAREFVGMAASALGLDFVPDGAGDLEATFGPEDVFRYIYAVLHSPEYRRRYADFLKSDFPRVPLTGDRGLFAALAALGERLAALHLMETEGGDAPAFPRGGDNRVERVRYAPPSADAPGRVRINEAQYFEGVSPETWAFAIGGYRPAEKWLKDRRNRVLSFDDVTHYRRVCGALAETPRLMARVDEAIAARGGWPLA